MSETPFIVLAVWFRAKHISIFSELIPQIFKKFYHHFVYRRFVNNFCTFLEILHFKIAILFRNFFMKQNIVPANVKHDYHSTNQNWGFSVYLFSFSSSFGTFQFSSCSIVLYVLVGWRRNKGFSFSQNFFF